ncbi:GerW family sporulation protein [Eubacteriales bacterium OttesenSCG-928-N13]|nr:GerW family sporulation protein [Eubacteriales bacterium OttesenSCG-928-N13]
MDKHPIESLMTTTMESIRDMVDVNTVIGEPVVSSDGSTVIPVSRVSFGFVAGGGEYNTAHTKTETARSSDLPFGGGTGAGVTVQPMGFLVVGKDSVRMLPAQYADTTDRLVELVPQLLSEIKSYMKDNKTKKPKQDLAPTNPS